MASRRELVMRAAVAAVDGGDKPADLTVERFRVRRARSDTDLPLTVLYPAAGPRGAAEEVDRPDHDAGVERTLTFRAETTIDPGNTPPDEALDPFGVWIVKALRADPTLGGLAVDLREVGIAYDADEFGRPISKLIQQFEVDYYTDEDDPEATP